MAVKPPVRSGPAGEVRIIGGLWKRSKLPVADRPGLRPTPDRVRETLFNWLGQDLAGWQVIDAFAGSGALGFEAASRGAAQVLMVEQDAALVAQLQRVCGQLGARNVTVRRGDGLAALRERGGSGTGGGNGSGAGAGAAAGPRADLILLDPPFEADLFAQALDAAVPALAPSGYLYLECPRAWDAAALQAHGLALHRHLKAGMVHAHLCRHA